VEMFNNAGEQQALAGDKEDQIRFEGEGMGL
jgi:hypothetical protein